MQHQAAEMLCLLYVPGGNANHVYDNSGLNRVTVRQTIELNHFLSIRHAPGDLCQHLGIDMSTDLDDRYSNLFLNAHINHQDRTHIYS